MSLPKTYSLALALLAGAAVSAAFLGASVRAGGGQAVPPIPDAHIFQQYARAIAEGRPYRHAPGDPPSTGSTSHAFPFALAGFYWLGAKGPRLSAAALGLGALGFLAAIAAAWLIAETIEPRASWLAALLVATSGPLAFNFFAGTDAVLFVPLACWTLAAGLRGRLGWLAAGLFACSWTRPEGAILSGLLLLAAGLPSRGEEAREDRFRLALAAMAGLAGSGGVALLNLWLTGQAGFHSTAGKGHFALFPFRSALWHSAADLGDLAKRLLLGLGEPGPDRFRDLPLIGGALACAGLLAAWRHSRKTLRLEAWWLASGGASALLVAASGWQGTHFDRHFAWFFPAWLAWLAAGTAWLGPKLPRAKLAGPLLVCALLAWQAAGLARALSEFGDGCRRMAGRIEFCRRANEALGVGASVSAAAGGGTPFYFLDRHYVRNPYGVESPMFSFPDSHVRALEVFESRPEWRPGWFVIEGGNPGGDWLAPVIAPMPEKARPAEGALALVRADWSRFEGADAPLSEAAVRAVEGMRLADSLDIGDPEDEARTGYRVRERSNGVRLELFAKAAKVAGGGREILDAGRAVLGSEAFRVRAEAGRPLRMVARVAFEGRPTAWADAISTPLVAFPKGIRLAVRINGREAGGIAVPAPSGEERGQFAEAVFDVPARLVASGTLDIEIEGDRHAFAYWFYQ